MLSNNHNIIKKLSKEILDNTEISNAFKNPNEFPSKLIEQISVEIAMNYINGKIDYIQADYVMNNIFSFWTSNNYYFENYAFPEFAFKCYEAFDEGEYYHKEDSIEIDPAEKYTKPLIRQLLKKRKIIT